MFGSTDYRPPSRFLDEIPSELMMMVGEQEKRGKGLGRHRDSVVAHAMRRQTAAVSERPAPVGAAGAHGAEQIGLRIGDDVSHERFGEGVIVDIEGQGDKAEAHRALPRRGREASAARVGAAHARRRPEPRAQPVVALVGAGVLVVVLDGAGVPRLTITASSPLTVLMLTGYCASRSAEIVLPPHSQWSGRSCAVQPEGCTAL